MSNQFLGWPTGSLNFAQQARPLDGWISMGKGIEYNTLTGMTRLVSNGGSQATPKHARRKKLLLLKE